MPVISCDCCGKPIPPLADDPEYRQGYTVQVGEFSQRVDDEDGDSYDEPDNDQRWYCPTCWTAIRTAFMKLYMCSCKEATAEAEHKGEVA